MPAIKIEQAPPGRSSDSPATPVPRERSASVRYAHPGVDTSRLRRSFFATPPEGNERAYIPLENRLRERSRSRERERVYLADQRMDYARSALYATDSRFFRTPSPERA